MAVSFLALKVHPLEPAAFVDEIKGFFAGRWLKNAPFGNILIAFR